MANLSKFKKKNLGVPPTLNEAGDNLNAPEIMPTTVSVDGRSTRKTGRTEQFATRVTPEFQKKVKMLAARDGLKIVELLEVALGYYEDSKGKL